MQKKKLPAFEDPMIDGLISDYFQENQAAQAYVAASDACEWPFVIDHLAIRCLDIDQRATPFLKNGYAYHDERVEYPDYGWWAKIYRKQGLPVLFIDQAYTDSSGGKSIIPDWVGRFGDQHLHHVAVLVDDIEKVLSVLQKNGVVFSGSVVGSRGSRLRQIFTASEVRDDTAYTVLELTERNGYTGFYPDQANRLMQASTKTRSKS